VDEFQDTDPIQAEVLLYLTSEDVDESDWRKLHPRPGALFVVGDPKQSIYRFRRADTATYNQVREIIVSKRGRVLELTTNFRSVGTICAWINTVFDDVFPDSSTREQAANARLEAHRPSGDARCGVLKLETKSGSRRRADLVAQEDADKIAQWIRWALDSRWQILTENEAGAVGSRDPEPADFLIIARNRLRLHTYAKALESRGIPYEISGGRALADSEELAALFPVFRAVADPDDPVALVSFLRGELWGVDDNALFRFRRAGGRFSYLSAPPKDVDERIVEGFEFLQEARRWARHLPPGAAMARIFERLGIIAYSASQNLGDTRSGNLLKTLTLARTLSAQGRSFADIVDHLLQVLNDREMEGMTVEPGRTNAVRLMNLHRAKGLEAPVVFLADPNTPIVHSPLFTINRDMEKPEGHTLIVANEGFHRRELARPRGWDERAAKETAFREAEEDRLLYVAATRAEQMLVVSVDTKELKRTNAQRIAGPWIRFLEAIDQDLHLPGFSTPTMSLATPEKLPEKFRALRGEMERNYAVVRQASYGVTQVTTVSDCDADRVPAQKGREDGAAWGRVLHRLLETTIRDPKRDIASQARFHLREEGLPLEALEEVLREVDGVRTSELWQRACRAKRRLVEVPFALTIPSVDLDIKDGPSETILKGVIDLAFSEGTEWIIVDYKSDRVRSSLRHLIARYAPQVRQYRRHWEELTGERTRAALLFTETGDAHWVD
jgi:ATP-dependent helicase/nuclease subunit A